MNPINLNETTIRAELEPGVTYSIKVTLNGIFDKSNDKYPRKDLRFGQGDAENRTITMFKDSTPDSVYDFNYTKGVTYVLTHIRYSRGGNNNEYDNLNPTNETTIENARALEENLDDDAETFAGGEPLDAHIDDALGDTTPTESDSGHVMTSVASTEPLPQFEIQTHSITVTSSDTAETAYARKALTYDVRSRLYSSTKADAIVPDGDLTLISLAPLRTSALDFDDVTVESEGSRTLDYDTERDRAIAKELLEESIKDSLRESYDVRGIDEVLSPTPIVESDAFSLHERYDLSVEIGPSGRAYLHVNFRHRQLSHLRLSRLDDDEIHPGLRVKTTYGRQRGYVVSHLSSKTSTEAFKRLGNRSVLQYHTDEETVDKETLAVIEREDDRVVEAYRMGHGGDNNPSVLPQKLLVVEPGPGQLDHFDHEFAKKARKKTRMSASRCTSKVTEFVGANRTFTFDGATVRFEPTLFAGNDEQRLVQLYGEHERVLTFADGKTGSHPSDTFSKGVAVPPDRFNVTMIRPEQRTDDTDTGWEELQQTLAKGGAEPELVNTIEYDAFDSPSKISIDIGSEIDPDETDAVLVVLPPDNGFEGIAPPGEVYHEGKKTLANAYIYSQMVDINNFGQGQTYLTRNVGLGLFAAAGGVPFTVEDSLPGDADMFIGVDVSRRYPDDSSDSQINVAATMTAVYRDGTILGHASTMPQLGEKLADEDVRDIMKQSVLGFNKIHGEYPSRIVIHRDGFMNEDLSLALELLDELGIAYDVVEIRKQPQTRIVAATEVQYDVPSKSVAAINENEPKATLVTFGSPETLAESEHSGLPRPIQIERVAGDTDIETIARQVYLLSQSHVGVHNSTARLPITTAFADRASKAATRGHLVQTSGLEKNLGFI